MKKVIHLFPAYKLGGAPVCVLRFIKSTKNLYEHSTIAKLEDLDLFLSFQDASNGECYNIDLTSFSLKNFFRVLKIILKLKPDIVHVHGKGGAIYGFLIAIISLKHFKLFYTFHGFYKKWEGFKWFLYLIFEKLFSALYDRCIAVSASEGSYVIECLKLNKHKLIVIPNGVYVTHENLPNLICDSLSKHKTNIVTLSRFSHQKDLETMIKSFFEIKKNYSVGLHIFGGFLANDVIYYQNVMKIIKDFNLQEDVYIWGEYSDAASFISYFDIYWSTAKFEGLPTAIIEAFLNKTLVVGTNCRGNVDLIINGKTGYLAEVGSVQSNVDVIIRSINNLNSDYTLQIINTAFEIALSYSIENQIERTNILYCS
jgi:glycosyltransferase involved in cell wall biosynthesis